MQDQPTQRKLAEFLGGQVTDGSGHLIFSEHATGFVE